MKRISQGILAAIIISSSALHLLAIEGLRISVQCPNVILSWPSTNTETYIVQYRPTLGTNTPWTILTNSLPAASGTNVTVFVHSNIVQCSLGGGTNSGGGDSGPPPLPQIASGLTSTAAPELEVVRADGSDAGPLALYPLGFDLTGFIIFDPTTGESVDGAGYSISPMTPLGSTTLDDPQPLDGGDSGGGGDPGFYEVVRIGPHFFGFTNGMILSGQVSVPMEFGNTNPAANLDMLFLYATNGGPVPNGFTFPVIPDEIATRITALWDTTLVTNGVYTFGVGGYLGDYSYSQYGMSMTEYYDNPITVTVSNVISFDPYPVGGDAFYIGAKTLYTNGTWEMNIYDNQSNLLATLPIALTGLPGPIDGDGYCAWPDPNNPTQPDPTARFPGFSLSNLDSTGNRLPWPSYVLAMTAISADGRSSKTGKTKVVIESPWAESPSSSTTVACYQQIFPYASLAYDEVIAMVQAVVTAQNNYHQLVNLPLFNNVDVPFEITMGSGWASVTNALATAGNRDFFYFGHGSPSSLGGGGLRARTVATLLGNNAVTTNSHPYRFVFLDGCQTGNGSFPQAFGIPQIENMPGSDFADKRGIRQRAFMGWDQTKIVGSFGGYWNDNHSSLIAGFYQNWQIRNPVTGYGLNGVRQAFNISASTNVMSGGMKIYGSKDLIIDF